jgi:hypothetical protein
VYDRVRLLLRVRNEDLLRFVGLVVGMLALCDEENFQVHASALGNRDCISKYAKWKHRPAHKAFAYTAGNYRNQACGMSWGCDTKQQAVEVAIQQCKIGAVKYKVPKTACRILESK